MKRLIALLLATVMIAAAFAGCGKKPVNDLFDDSVSYTWKTAVSALAKYWNPHDYETEDDSFPLDYIQVGFYSFIFNDELHKVDGKNPYEGYVIIPEMAASEPVDVTEKIKAEHPEFGIPESATSGYAYTIDLNKKACWEDGTPINADTYVYSMQQLLNPELLNYRAADYYSQSLSIAGAEEYANNGNTVKKINSADAETMDVAFADLTKGADGVYTTADGGKAYFGLKTGYEWLSGNSLTAYYNAGYISDDVWSVLSANADTDGYTPVTDDTIDALYAFTGSDVWGNESKDQLGFYVSYDYTYPVVTYDSVGLYKSGEYQITMVLDKSLSGFNLLYNLSGNWLVYEPYYEACKKQDGDSWSTTYGTSVETTMSYGPYKMVSFQADKALRLERNENWYGYTDGQHMYKDPTDGQVYNMYMTSAIDCQQVDESSTRKMMFLKGELMGYGLGSEDFATYRNSEFCYATPDETIYFLILNGHKQAIADREANAGFDKTKYDLETMTLTSFRQAVANTYDKELFASTVSPSRSGGYGLIGNAYLYDPETGARYRDTDQAKQVLCDFYAVDTSKYDSLDDAVASITGYDPETAKVLYKQAFDEAIAAGYITDTDGDGISDQTIEIEYALSVDNDFMTTTIDYLNTKMAEVTVGTPFEGKIVFKKSAPYGNDWFDKLQAGLTDTVLGGWGGSAFDPFSLTDLYTNSSRQYDAGWFDATQTDLTLDVNVAGAGAKKAEMKTLTMNLKEWSDALNGTTITVDGVEYNFGTDAADVETRLEILAAIEGAVLSTYNYIPMLQNASMALLSQQVYYVVEEYNPVMGRGGLAYTKYNYNDAEWAEYVASQGGELKY